MNCWETLRVREQRKANFTTMNSWETLREQRKAKFTSITLEICNVMSSSHSHSTVLKYNYIEP